MFRRLFDPSAGLLFDGEDGTGGGAVEPAAPVAEPVVAEPAAPVAEPGAGPWASDLNTYFEDEAGRSAADRFLREKIQPHVTQLEQTHSQYADARSLYDDLQEDPLGTYLAVTAELLGDDARDQIAELIAAGHSPEAATEAVATEAVATEAVATEAQPPALDPTLAAMKDEYERNQAVESFATEMQRVGVPDTEKPLFAPFVMAADGDFDVALNGYNQWKATAAQTLGFEHSPAPVEPAAPATLGTVSDAPAAPAVTKQYSSMDDALDDTLAEMRARREGPTPVGTV